MAQSPGDRVAATHLEYDAVIATRNRPDALALSLPLLVGQTRPPRRLIVIDSSDDHAPVAAAVAKSVTGWNGDLVIEHSAKGLPLQRNRGLAHVTAPVVLFPDDDSLLYPDAAEQILAVYERDGDAAIAAVCGTEDLSPPPGFKDALVYQLSPVHKREARFRRLRNRIEKRIRGAKPAIELGRLLTSNFRIPDWLNEMDAVQVEYMTGFRMSFRTSVIRPFGFDETLGGYALDEDVDASFTAARSGLIIAALRSRIYHHRFPGGRPSGFGLGVIEVLNRHYVIRKHVLAAGLDAGAAKMFRGSLRRFFGMKLAASAAAIRTEFGRERIRGAIAGETAGSKLWQADAEELSAVYAAQLRRLQL